MLVVQKHKTNKSIPCQQDTPQVFVICERPTRLFIIFVCYTRKWKPNYYARDWLFSIISKDRGLYSQPSNPHPPLSFSASPFPSLSISCSSCPVARELWQLSLHSKPDSDDTRKSVYSLSSLSLLSILLSRSLSPLFLSMY